MTFTMQFTAQNIIRGVVNFIFNKENVPYYNDLTTNCRHYIMKHTLMGKQNKALMSPPCHFYSISPSQNSVINWQWEYFKYENTSPIGLQICIISPSRILEFG